MKLPKNQLAETNDLNPILDEMEASLNDLREEMDSKVEMEDMPAFPTEITVSNLPEVQKVEITNLPEKDDSEQVQTLKDIKEALSAFSGKDVNLAQVESLLGELIHMSSSEEEIDLRPKFDELKDILTTLNDNVSSIETPLPFDYLKLAEIIRENVKIRVAGGGSAGVEYVKNVAGQQINPSTEEKQDDIITAINNIQDSETVGELEKHTDVLNEIRSAVQAISSAKGVAADMRVTLLSGTVTTVTTVTTVATVTGITNIGGIPAVQLIPSNQNIAAVLSNINNVTV